MDGGYKLRGALFLRFFLQAVLNRWNEGVAKLDLVEQADGAELLGMTCQFRIIGEGDGQQTRGGESRFDGFRFHPPAVWHVNIHDHYVRGEITEHREKLIVVASLADQLDVGLRTQNKLHHTAQRFRIIGKQDANSHLFIAIRSIGFFVQTTLFSDEKFVDPPRQSLPGSNVIVKPVVDRLCRNERGNYHCRDSRSVLSEPKLVSVRSSECGPVAGLDCPGETT